MISRLDFSLLKKYSLFWKAAGFLGAYVGWILFFRLLVLTFTTYFVISSSPASAGYQDINEALNSAELGIIGLGSFIFVSLIPLLNPLTSTTLREIFTPENFEKRFLFGFSRGAVFSCAVILAFLISGTYRYLGFFIHFEDTSFALGNVILRSLGLGVLVYCEEFIFRKKLLSQLRAAFEKTRISEKNSLHFSVLLVSIFFCAVKALQFDLGWMHQLTLFLVSLSLSFRALQNGDFTDGAGFWTAVLIIFHPLLSLPIFGNDFSGLILVKFQAGVREDTVSATGNLLRIFSGGQGGPLAAVALQLLFLLDTMRCILRYSQIKKSTP